MNLLGLRGVLLSVFLATSAGCAAQADVTDEGSAAIGEEAAFTVAKVKVAGPDDPADQYLLEVTVGRISEARFNELHARFGTKPGRFDAAKSYALGDFLPSFARAVLGKALEPYTTPADPSLVAAMKSKDMATDGQAHVNANCHSVTWQWINHLQGRGTDDAVLTLVDGEVLFAKISGFREVREGDLQAGDVYFTKGDGGLEQTDAILHSGVYLGDGLVFEKANPGEAFPYRIARLEDVTAKYRRVDPNIEILYRRVGASPVLPTLVEDLSLVERKSELGLDAVEDRVLAQYLLQEEFNFETERSDFTIGQLLSSAKAPADKLHALRR